MERTRKRKSSPVLSPLMYHGDYSEPVPKGFVGIFMHLFNDDEDKKPDDGKIDKFEDWLLIQASQMYEKSRAENTREEAIDKICYLQHHKK